jgi:zinc/manganese transport system substrate-binding protein
MFRRTWIALAMGVSLVALPALAKVNVFACEPEWAALASEVGGEDVTVFSATTARQDPHQVQARPALIARMRAADLVICTGAELEVGWLPLLLRQSANTRVQPGSAGYLEAADFVTLLDLPDRLDRADGDVHAAGNPHLHLDPRNIQAIATALAQRLAFIDPGRAAAHVAREKDFQGRWTAAIQRWQEAAQALRGAKVLVHHQDWIYLQNWLGLLETGSIEPKPGVPPGTAHLAALLDAIPRTGPIMILYAAYQDPRGARYIADRSGLPAVMLPFTVGGSEKAIDLVGLFDDTIARLLAATRN